MSKIKRKIYRTFLLSAIALGMTSFTLVAQLSLPQVYEDAVYDEGVQLYEDQVYGYAKERFEAFLSIPEGERSPVWKSRQVRARLYKSLCTLWMEGPSAEHDLTTLIHQYRPDPIVFEAAMEVANAHYNEKDYEQAISFYELIDLDQVDTDIKAEVTFKNGYCHFVKKKFDLAGANFIQSATYRTVYYYPSNYYLGMIAFFDKDYGQAADYFEKVAPSKKYKSFVPYYLTQIYFSEGEYQKVVDYGEQQLNTPDLEKEAEIKSLIGRSYFELGNNDKALSYLREYMSLSTDLSASDHYQLGYLSYKEESYKEAIKHLSVITSLTNDIGLQANYYLAHAYLKMGNKEAARSGFANVKRLAKEQALKDESTYNYGLLSADLGYDREAVNAMMEISPSSSYYPATQEALAGLFLQTSDYDNAIKILDGLDKSNPILKEAYQKVNFYKGLQLYNEEKYSESLTYLDKSLQYAIDQQIHAETQFTKGVIQHKQGKYESSSKSLNSYQTLRSTNDHYNRYIATYTIGYNYLKQKKYAEAREQFNQTITAIDQQKDLDPYIKGHILSDALIRSADCAFHYNQYEEANANYQRAFGLKKGQFVYAYYQSALIYGLRNDVIQKIVILEDLQKQFPTSALADDALLEAGRTYLKLGKYDEAAMPLLSLVKTYEASENTTQAYLTLGLISYNKGSIKEAVKYYQKVFDHNPTESERQDAFRALQEIYVHDLKDPDEYVAFIETISGGKIENAVRDSLNYKTAYNSYANAEYDDAIQNLSTYLTKFPNGLYHIEAHYLRAECAALDKDYSNAYRDYSYVIDQGVSKYFEKSLYKGALIAYNELNNFEQSYSYYNQLRKLNIESAKKVEATLGALRSAYRLKKYNQVEQLAKSFHNLPDVSKSDQLIVDYYQANSLYEQGKYDEAIEPLNRLSKGSQDQYAAEARYLIASIYYEKKEFQIAEEMCRLAIKENTNYPYWVAKSILLLSDVLVEKGDTFNAKAALQAIIENYKEDKDLVNQAKRKLIDLEKLEQAENQILKESEGQLLELEEN